MSMIVLGSIQANSENSSQEGIFLPWKNPYNIITHETYLLIERILTCFVNPLIFCVGAPTNIINCVVFLREGLRDRMNLCLFCLALVDLLFVVLFCFAGSHCLVGFVRPELENWWKWSVHVNTLGLYQGFLLCSGCLTMIISVERCVCVFLPLKAATLITTRTMAVLIVSTVVSIQLLCVTYPLKMEVVRIHDTVANLTDYTLVTTAFYARSPVLFDVVQKTLVSTVIPLLCFVVVVVATSITVLQIKRTIAWRTQAVGSGEQAAKTSTTSQQIALIRMLVVVSTVFIFTSSPVVAFSIASSVQPEFFMDGRYSNIFLASHALYLSLSMFNSSINFFVYVRRSSRFRQTLRALPGFAVCIRRHENLTVVSTNTELPSTRISSTEGVGTQ